MDESKDLETSEFFQKNINPKNEKLIGKHADWLIRSATFICSSYAFHRGLLPEEAFEFVRILNRNGKYPIFNLKHDKSRLNKQSLQTITDSIKEKKVSQFFYAVIVNGKSDDMVECMRFEFDYNTASLSVKMPNATNARISSGYDFAVDLVEILDKVRVICDCLGELPANSSAAIMVQYNENIKDLPKNFKYHPYDPINQSLKSIPIATFPTPSTLMIVEIRSKCMNGSSADDFRRLVDERLSYKPSNANETFHPSKQNDSANQSGDKEDADRAPKDPGDDVLYLSGKSPPSKHRKDLTSPVKTPKENNVKSPGTEVSDDTAADDKMSNENIMEHARNDPHSPEHEMERPQNVLEGAREELHSPVHQQERPDGQDDDLNSLRSDESNYSRAYLKRNLSPVHPYDSQRSEPEPKKLCPISCYNVLALNDLEVNLDAVEEIF